MRINDIQNKQKKIMVLTKHKDDKHMNAGKTRSKQMKDMLR